MMAGGVILASTIFIQAGPGSIVLGLTGQFLGFLLLALGTLPASPSTSLAGGISAFSGSLIWLLSWSWPLFGGWFIPIPIWVWASVAAAVYLAAQSSISRKVASAEACSAPFLPSDPSAQQSRRISTPYSPPRTRTWGSPLEPSAPQRSLY